MRTALLFNKKHISCRTICQRKVKKKIIISFIDEMIAVNRKIVVSLAYFQKILNSSFTVAQRYTSLMNSIANIPTISRKNYFMHLYPVLRKSSNQWQEFGWKKEHMFGIGSRLCAAYLCFVLFSSSFFAAFFYFHAMYSLWNAFYVHCVCSLFPHSSFR